MVSKSITIVKSSVAVLGILDCVYPWQFSLINIGLVIGSFGLFFEIYVQECRNKAAKKRAMEKARKILKNSNQLGHFIIILKSRYEFKRIFILAGQNNHPFLLHNIRLFIIDHLEYRLLYFLLINHSFQ